MKQQDLWAETTSSAPVLPGWLDRPPAEIPPFSVLDARSGIWQERKRLWLDLGIESELGRETIGTNFRIAPDVGTNDRSGDAYGSHQLRKGTMTDITAGTSPEIAERFEASGNTVSIFDPVLCELMYRWFCPRGGLILDPFAGGSVRGVVAGMLGYRYIGIDLQAKQIEANRKQWRKIGQGAPGSVEWVCGDAREASSIAKSWYDFIFSCPPYGWLERYSDDRNDISTLSDYGSFTLAYRSIIVGCLKMLRPDRFAAWVVGGFRGGKGELYDLTGASVEAFGRTGAYLYNDAVLVTMVGSLPIRAAFQFDRGRKLGRSHQNVLVFCKDDNERAARLCRDGLPKEDVL